MGRMHRLSSIYKIKLEPGTKCLYCDRASRHLALCQRHYNRWYQGVPMEDVKAPPFEPNREALAWAAGFFDGEGSTGIQRVGDRWKGIRISVRQVHKDTLDRFCESIGNLGKVSGPERGPSLTIPGRQPIYTWRCQLFEHVQQILCYLWPWLTPHKKAQAKIAMQRYMENGNHRSLNS